MQRERERESASSRLVASFPQINGLSYAALGETAGGRQGWSVVSDDDDLRLVSITCEMQYHLYILVVDALDLRQATCSAGLFRVYP